MRNFLIALACCQIGCAKPGPPTGGAIDRTPPTIVRHFPGADTVGVPLDAVIEVHFNERMDRTRTEEALFIAPARPVQTRWKGNILQLRFAEGLQTDRTYVITLGTDSRDLRGNGLTSPFTFAFATGAQLDLGQIEGKVFRQHRPAGDIHVWLYDLGHPWDSFEKSAPAYRTQTDKEGHYQFSRISGGSYRLFAFADRNRNQAWDSDEECALPTTDIVADRDGTIEAGDLALFHPGAPTLKRLQALDNRRLVFQFDRAVPPQHLQVEIANLKIAGFYTHPDDDTKLYALTAVQVQGKKYTPTTLQVQGRPLNWDDEVRGSGRSDQTPPLLAAKHPEDRLLTQGDTLSLVFSEAMETAATAPAWIPSDSTQTPEGTWNWLALNRLCFIPAQPFAPGTYHLHGLTRHWRDMAGLAIADTTFDWHFTVPEPAELSQLGGQISGRLSRLGPLWLTALQQEGGRVYPVQADKEGRFSLTRLPPGTYRVFAFVDRNLNQVPDWGILAPYSPAEPYAALAKPPTLSAGDRLDSLLLEIK